MNENSGGTGPGPTIVGPRPEGGGGARKDIPRGMERLLTLAGISPEWRSRVLADPVATAGEAGIELSDSERSILKAVPPSSISSMADSIAARSGRPTLAQAAAGIAAAALLATNLAACGGSRPDVPKPNSALVAPSPAAPIAWLGSLDEALAKAKAGNRAVMVVIPHPKPGITFLRNPRPTQGHNFDLPNPPVEEKSQKVVLSESLEFRKAVNAAGLVSLRLPAPVRPPDPPPGASPEQSRRAMEALKLFEDEYEAWFRGISSSIGSLSTRERERQKDLPAVSFLAPDGTILKVLRQPTEESQLIDAVKAVPPLLAKWMTERRAPTPIPPVTAGERPDEPDPEPSP